MGFPFFIFDYILVLLFIHSISFRVTSLALGQSHDCSMPVKYFWKLCLKSTSNKRLNITKYAVSHESWNVEYVVYIELMDIWHWCHIIQIYTVAIIYGHPILQYTKDILSALDQPHHTDTLLSIQATDMLSSFTQWKWTLTETVIPSLQEGLQCQQIINYSINHKICGWFHFAYSFECIAPDG